MYGITEKGKGIYSTYHIVNLKSLTRTARYVRNGRGSSRYGSMCVARFLARINSRNKL